MEPLESKLVELATEFKSFTEKAKEEQKNTGAIASETKTAVDAVRAEIAKMQAQIDAVDAKSQTVNFQPAQIKSIGQMVTEHEAYAAGKARSFMSKEHISCFFNTSAFPTSVKTNITDTTLGSGTSGVLMPQRLPGITVTAQQELRIRDLMRVRQLTSGTSYDWVAQKTRTNAPSPQVEAAAKAESTYLWETKSDTVHTIAHFVNVSRQALDDVDFLRSQIDSELMYGLKLKEEQEILSGDGTGEHLKGLITQATAYAGTYAVAADTKLDTLRHAKLEARLLGLGTFAPDAFVLNPIDMQKIELIKQDISTANTGSYIVGDPRTGAVVKFVWGLPVVESDSIPSGKFLVGAFSTAAELVDRMAATIDISFEHSTNFTANLATILCEERVGLAVRRPNAFIYGTV